MFLFLKRLVSLKNIKDIYRQSNLSPSITLLSQDGEKKTPGQGRTTRKKGTAATKNGKNVNQQERLEGKKKKV